MARNSNAKGASYERWVCNMLSLWVSRHTREDLFWRSAMSGGRATMQSKRAPGNKKQHITAHAADIVATHKMGHILLDNFIIECKWYKDLQVQQLIYGLKSSNMRVFWDKLAEDAAKYKRRPMLIARMNNKPDLLCTNKAGREWLRPVKPQIQAYHVPTGMYMYFLRDVLATDFGKLRKEYATHVLKRRRLGQR